MIVRSKMTANNVYRGVHGAEAYFSAVYEGSEELQKISENAIFGNATPNGNLALQGAFAPEPFKPEADLLAPEFYIDLVDAGLEVDPGFVLMVPMRKSFQSDPGQFGGDHAVAFRYVSAGNISANLFLMVANPKAIGTLDAVDLATMAVRVCDGRRGEAEIAVLEKMLARDIENAKSGPPSYHSNITAEEWMERCTSINRRRLARAKGEA